MDLVFYVTYHYLEKKPKWMQDALGITPKPLYDILLDLTIKVLILFTILYVARHVFMSLYTLHDGRRRRLRRLEYIYGDLLESELQKQEDARKRNEHIRNNEQAAPQRQEE